MHIRQVTVSKTISQKRSAKQFESDGTEKFASVTADLYPGDKFEECVRELEGAVDYVLYYEESEQVASEHPQKQITDEKEGEPPTQKQLDFLRDLIVRLPKEEQLAVQPAPRTKMDATRSIQRVQNRLDVLKAEAKK